MTALVLTGAVGNEHSLTDGPMVVQYMYVCCVVCESSGESSFVGMYRNSGALLSFLTAVCVCVCVLGLYTCTCSAASTHVIGPATGNQCWLQALIRRFP